MDGCSVTRSGSLAEDCYTLGIVVVAQCLGKERKGNGMEIKNPFQEEGGGGEQSIMPSVLCLHQFVQSQPVPLRDVFNLFSSLTSDRSSSSYISLCNVLLMTAVISHNMPVVTYHLSLCALQQLSLLIQFTQTCRVQAGAEVPF